MSGFKYFLNKATTIHSDRYDYFKVEYKNCYEKLEIICKLHGSFWQTPQVHLRGAGYQTCNGGVKDNQKSYFDKLYKIHGNKYDYSDAIYVNSVSKIKIICLTHGIFWQRARYKLISMWENDLNHENET